MVKYGIRVAHKPKNTEQAKDEEKSGVVYRISRCEVGKTSKLLMPRMHEHKSVVRRHDTNSHIWAHMPETRHDVNFKKVKVQAQAKSKGSRFV